MSSKNRPDTERLRQALRDGDPARDGLAPDSTEFERMRCRMLSTADSVPGPIGVPARAMAVAAVIVLTAALGFGLWRDGATDLGPVGPPRPSVPHLTHPGSREMPAARDARQIRFSTPGGTRVVWTLDPDFEV